MITVVIGQAGAGKTTFVRNNFVRNPVLVGSPIKHTVCNDTILLGDYVSDIRNQGTDTLPKNSLKAIIDFVRNNRDRRIVGEGQRITNRRFFDFLVGENIKFELVLIRTSIPNSLIRTGYPVSFVRATRNASHNLFLAYSQFAELAYVVDT